MKTMRKKVMTMEQMIVTRFRRRQENLRAGLKFRGGGSIFSTGYEKERRRLRDETISATRAREQRETSSRQLYLERGRQQCGTGEFYRGDIAQSRIGRIRMFKPTEPLAWPDVIRMINGPSTGDCDINMSGTVAKRRKGDFLGGTGSGSGFLAQGF